MAWKNLRVNQVKTVDGKKLDGFNIVLPESVFKIIERGEEILWETDKGISLKLKGNIAKR